MGLLEAIILAVLAASTPLLIAATGELVTERAGVLNLGVEGMMIVGAACGFGGAWLSGSVFVGAICGILAGTALSLVFALMTLGPCGQSGRHRPRAHHPRHRRVRPDRRRFCRRANYAGAASLYPRPHRYSLCRPYPVRGRRLRLFLDIADRRRLAVPVSHPRRSDPARRRRQSRLGACARLSRAENPHVRGDVRRRLRRTWRAHICRLPIRRSSFPE